MDDDATRFPDRDRVVRYLRDQLVGPVEGSDEVLYERAPQHRYLTAILFPMSLEVAAPGVGEPVDDSEEVDDRPGGIPEEDDEDPVTLSGQSRPSSAGISFMATRRSAIVVDVHAARYRSIAEDEWQREPLDLVGKDALRIDPPTLGASRKLHLWGRTAMVRVSWRPHRDGVIVTVVLVNCNVLEERSAVLPERACSR